MYSEESDAYDSGHEQEEFTTLAETVRQFPNYSAASRDSCAWVNAVKGHQIPVAKLELYVSRLKKSPAYGQVVGLGIRPKPKSQVVPFVRLDMDNEGKGIHFNAVQYGNSSQKLAAVLHPTVAMSVNQRTSLYLDYIKALRNRSPQFIWEWWSTGRAGLCEEPGELDL